MKIQSQDLPGCGAGEDVDLGKWPTKVKPVYKSSEQYKKVLADHVAHLSAQQQGQSAHVTFANSWVEHRLSEQGQTTERLIVAEGQAQAADQISIGNCITSLRFLGANDWCEFVETHSLVEETLRTAPAQVYAAMDFATRDRYRHVIEEIAKPKASRTVRLRTSYGWTSKWSKPLGPWSWKS